MNKKIICSVFIFMMLFSTVSFKANADIPAGTVVLGDKAYSLAYANDASNYEEISKAFGQCGGKIYIKAPWGDWIDNVKMEKIGDVSIIPQVVYKDSEGNETIYDEHDGKTVEAEDFYVVDIF